MPSQTGGQWWRAPLPFGAGNEGRSICLRLVMLKAASWQGSYTMCQRFIGPHHANSSSWLLPETWKDAFLHSVGSWVLLDCCLQQRSFCITALYKECMVCLGYPQVLMGRKVVIISGAPKESSWAKRGIAEAVSFLIMLHNAQCTVISCWD